MEDPLFQALFLAWDYIADQDGQSLMSEGMSEKQISSYIGTMSDMMGKHQGTQIKLEEPWKVNRGESSWGGERKVLGKEAACMKAQRWEYM